MTLDAYLKQELTDPESGFAIGVNGAIAEFFRDAEEPGVRTEEGACTVCTPRGAMRIRLRGDVFPVAMETPSRNPEYWQQRVALCLNVGQAAMAKRNAVTALGADADAIRAADRSLLLFDLGIGIPHVDVCVRTDDDGLIAMLTGAFGRNFLRERPELVDAIIRTGPHRVFISRLGRIEVYTPIPTAHTVGGPHTHLLPDLLGKPDAATEWIAVGARACLDVYPANPARRESGEPRAFDPARHARFQRALAAWGPPAYVEEKRRTLDWLRRGVPPHACAPATGPLARVGRRMAVRQAGRTQPDSPLLAAWRRAVEGGRSVGPGNDPEAR